MRILHVVHVFPPEGKTGTELYTYNLVKELSRRGHEVSVFAPTYVFDHPCYHLQRDVYDGVNVTRIHNRFATMQDMFKSYRDIEVEKAFRAHLMEFRPDIVHVQHLIGLSLSLVEVAREYGTPIVFTLHDYWYFCPRIQLLDGNGEICAGPTDGAKCGWCIAGFSDDSNNAELLSGDMPQEQKSVVKKLLPRNLKHRLKTMLVPEIEDLWRLREEIALLQCKNLELKHDVERLYRASSHYVQRYNYAMSVLNQANRLITPSAFVKDKYASLGTVSAEMSVIPHGLDASRFGAKSKMKSDIVRFGYFGGLLKHKGVEVLLKAFENVGARPASLQIFGECPNEEYRKKLLKLSRADKVIFRGSYNNSDMSDLLSEIDVVVVPSLWEETFNLVVREAFMEKTPVVASRIGALAEAVNDGTDGFLVEPGNVEDLSEKMMMIISDPEILTRLRKNMKPVKEIGFHVSEIEEIYQDVLAMNEHR